MNRATSGDPEVWAFVDEYGNPNLSTETDGVSDYFIVAVVLVEGRDLAQLRTQVEALRVSVFQAGEMKSKKLGKNRPRWVKLLTELGSLPFRFYGLAVDKRELGRASGFQWKDAFYKNLCGRAYGKIMRHFPDLHLRADEYGRTEFMTSFASYIERNHRTSLFDAGTFEFVDGKTEVLVQLADIVAGVLARCFDPGMLLPQPAELLSLIGDRALLIDEWPVRYRLRAGSGEIPSSGPDERIARYSLERAELFIQERDDAVDEDTRAQVAVLERLAFERRFADARSLPAGALIDHLRERRLTEKGETWLRRSVIAPLRDRGILITKPSLGYKLPDRRADIVAFVRHAESVCVPMLNRVNAACDAVKMATNGEIDVLADGDLENVQRLIRSLEIGTPVLEPVEP